MAGSGHFAVVGSDILESVGGIGLLWYTPEEFGDFILRADWRSSSVFDNSGVFLRFPALGSNNPANDWRLAVDRGYEVQIEARGYNPDTNSTGSPSRSEEHTSELQSRGHLVCRLLLEKKKAGRSQSRLAMQFILR